MTSGVACGPSRIQLFPWQRSVSRLWSIVAAGLLAIGAASCGGSVSETTACKDFSACYYKAGGTQGALDSMYGVGGSCWTSAAQADACSATCQDAIDAYKSNGTAARAGCTFQ
jgi:hypothetical protein